MADAPKRYFPLNFMLAIGIGGAGGAIFALLGAPLPWILGSMTFCLVAALGRVPVKIPMKIRLPMSAVIGVMLGSSYTPQVLQSLSGWLIPLLGLTAFLFTAAVTGIAYFVHVARYDFKTAYFCGMPGGLMEMTLLGEQYGADIRKIALAHSARITLVIFALPFLISLIGDGSIVSGNSTAIGIRDLTEKDWGWFLATAAFGMCLGHFLRLPAKYLLGPMLVSVVVHLLGLSDFTPPWEIIIVAQIVIGASIGSRFAGDAFGEIVNIIRLSLGSTAILISLAVLFSVLVSLISDFAIVDLILAYSPGGLTEMGMIALALNIEVAFVASHHLFRIFCVTGGAGFAARLQSRMTKEAA